MYFNELQPIILIKPIWNYSSTAACATFINDYFPIGYITGVCEVYALWYDFFLKLLLFKHYYSMAAWAAARRAMGTRNGEQLT